MVGVDGRSMRFARDIRQQLEALMRGKAGEPPLGASCWHDRLGCCASGSPCMQTSLWGRWPSVHAAGGTTEGGSRLGAGVMKRGREGRGDGGGSGGKRPCGLAGTYALRMALTPDPRSAGVIPSTKGSL